MCQVAVHLTYGAESGYALIDRALYLAQDWAADDERRELAHVPNELCFATKPQLAAMLLERARVLGLPARRVAADEVYGGCCEVIVMRASRARRTSRRFPGRSSGRRVHRSPRSSAWDGGSPEARRRW